MKKRLLKITGIAIGIVLIIVLYKTFFSNNAVVPVTIQTEVVAKGEISAVITATGTIEPTKQVEVGTQVSGVVKKIYVDYNSRVKAGQLIAELDKTNLLESVTEAKASYDAALNEQQYLQKIFTRQKELFASKLISEADYDEASYKLNSAKASVAQRYADLSKAKTNLSYADIYSPIDGVILSMDVEEGQTVAASFSTPTLFTIAQDLTHMQVEADVDEADIGSVSEGQRVTFTVDAYPEEEFSGTVTQVRLNATVTSSVVTYAVVVKADNEGQKLKPGLTATISIFTKELKDVLVIKEKAISFQPDQTLLMEYDKQHKIKPGKPLVLPASNDSSVKTVWVKTTGGKLEPRSIHVGTSDGINIQVLDGLKAGEQVLLSLTQESAVATEATAESGSSPFMPKPPGKNKK